MVKGFIHSIESMGLLDGPGIRTIAFFQGCALRCSYCHNPDTWKLSTGKEYTPADLIKIVERFRPYFKNSGGVTFSGGDPLMQPEFLIQCLKLCREKGIHSTIDTSGIGISDYYEEILTYTDLVLLDLKHVDEEGFKELTGHSMEELKKFLKTLKKVKNKVWVRHVIVPGITDSEEHLDRLAELINTIDNVERIELLPYHTIGAHKYEQLNIPYKLKDLHPMDKEKTKELQKYLESKLINLKK